MRGHGTVPCPCGYALQGGGRRSQIMTVCAREKRKDDKTDRTDITGIGERVSAGIRSSSILEPQ